MESTIQECNKNPHGTFECSNSNVAEVMCNDGTSHARKIASLDFAQLVLMVMLD